MNDTTGLIARRRALLGPNMSTFYEDPVHIVKGEGVWLWDADGRKYLDCYNNVPHVGHCHPKVVEAICRQAGTLNVHTRYLHEGILEYVEALTSTFDDPLNTAIMTCTGSEANDIALRMARAVSGNKGVIATDHTYHGNTMAVSQLSRTNPPPDAWDNVAFVPAPDSYRPLGGVAGDGHAQAFASAVEAAIAELVERGHGLSECPPAPYSMGSLIHDAERLLDHLEVKDCLFVGLSIGGMIAQGLAVKRLDQVRAMVLSNTAAKIGTPLSWHERTAAVAGGGIEAIADGVLEKWFSKKFRETPEISLWRAMLTRQPVAGYSGCCAAIAGTDFYTTTAALTLPTLAIAGDHDGATPPDLVRETAALIKGSRFEILRGTGHLPCVEDPAGYAALLTDFMKDIGHI